MPVTGRLTVDGQMPKVEGNIPVSPSPGSPRADPAIRDENLQKTRPNYHGGPLPILRTSGPSQPRSNTPASPVTCADSGSL